MEEASIEESDSGAWHGLIASLSVTALYVLKTHGIHNSSTGLGPLSLLFTNARKRCRFAVKVWSIVQAFVQLPHLPQQDNNGHRRQGSRY